MLIISFVNKLFSVVEDLSNIGRLLADLFGSRLLLNCYLLMLFATKRFSKTLIDSFLKEVCIEFFTFFRFELWSLNLLAVLLLSTLV